MSNLFCLPINGLEGEVTTPRQCAAHQSPRYLAEQKNAGYVGGYYVAYTPHSLGNIWKLKKQPVPRQTWLLNVRRFDEIAAGGGPSLTPGGDPSTARGQLQTKALRANNLLFQDLCGWAVLNTGWCRVMFVGLYSPWTSFNFNIP